MANISEILARPELVAKCPNTEVRTMFNNIIELAFCEYAELQQEGARLKEKLKTKSPTLFLQFQEYFNEFDAIMTNEEDSEEKGYDAEIAARVANIERLKKENEDIDRRIAERNRSVDVIVKKIANDMLPSGGPRALGARNRPVAQDDASGALSCMSGKYKCSIM